MLTFLLSRLREPSTYAGLGAMLAAVGLHPTQALLGSAVNVAVALAGLAAVLLPEAKATKVILPSMPPAQPLGQQDQPFSPKRS